MQWKQQLQQLLKQANHDNSPPRIAIVGVGQELQGDDGAGVAVVRRLAGLVQPDESLCLIEAGHAPENVLGSIIRFHPSHILFVDAIKANTPPGTIHWLPAGEADSVGGSTHTLSLGMLANYLQLETGATVYVIGIEPQNVAFNIALGAELSPPVRLAVEACAETLARYWRSALLACSASSSGGVSVVKT
jgi:hydrogenase 3 maturation protease